MIFIFSIATSYIKKIPTIFDKDFKKDLKNDNGI